jgi:hypothetical protein
LVPELPPAGVPEWPAAAVDARPGIAAPSTAARPIDASVAPVAMPAESRRVRASRSSRRLIAFCSADRMLVLPGDPASTSIHDRQR